MKNNMTELVDVMSTLAGSRQFACSGLDCEFCPFWVGTQWTTNDKPYNNGLVFEAVGMEDHKPLGTTDRTYCALTYLRERNKLLKSMNETS